MATKRRRRLVEAGGVEVFEVRVVQWIGENGQFYTSADISSDGSEVALVEILGAMELAKLEIIGLYEV